ncbi:hypothetical protein FPV67DRAFT_1475336, partial [Lyophyllum atratum]
MIYLPLELIQEIVQKLSAPEYPLQYGHKRDATRALCQLSLVNHVLFDIATPHLYSSIVISSHHELRAFLATPSSLRGYSRFLWLRSRSLTHKPFPDSDIYPLIADLLYSLGPQLRRLALDIPGNEIDTSYLLRDALKCCTYLEEFTRSGYSPMLVVPPHPIWSGWAALRRLVLDGPLINDTFTDFISELAHLTHLALIEPRWKYSDDGTEIAAFLRLLEAGQNFQRVLFIYCSDDELHLSTLRRLRAVVKYRGLRDRLDVLYMVKREPGPTPMKLIRRQIGEGTLWDLHSHNITEYPI